MGMHVRGNWKSKSAYTIKLCSFPYLIFETPPFHTHTTSPVIKRQVIAVSWKVKLVVSLSRATLNSIKKLTDIAMPRIGCVMIDALRGRTWMGLAVLLYPGGHIKTCSTRIPTRKTHQVARCSCPMSTHHHLTNKHLQFCKRQHH